MTHAMWSACAAAVACGVALLYRRARFGGRLLITAALIACAAWTTRLLMLYAFAMLRPDISHAECLRLAVGW